MTARTSRPGYLWYRRHTAAYLFYIFPRDKVENKIMTKARNHVLVSQTFDIGITTHLEGRLTKKHTQITWKQQTYFQKHALLHTQYQYCFFLAEASVYCLCLLLSTSACVSHEFVRVISHHPHYMQLGSLNLDRMCEMPWLRSLLFSVSFMLTLTLTFKVKLTFKSNFTQFWVCPSNQWPPIQVMISKFGSKIHLSTIKISNLGLCGLVLQFDLEF